MIGSVSSGFRRRRRPNASRAEVAATARDIGTRQLHPADPGDLRRVTAGRESCVCRSDPWLWIAPPSKLLRSEARARCDFSLASGVAAAARERARTFAGSADVTDSDSATSRAARELSGRIVNPRSAAIVGSVAGAGLAVEPAAASEVFTPGFAAASTARVASDTETVTAGSAEPTAPAAVDPEAAATAGSVAGEIVGAPRGGSKVKGST
jgi:hypothetical protein